MADAHDTVYGSEDQRLDSTPLSTVILRNSGSRSQRRFKHAVYGRGQGLAVAIEQRLRIFSLDAVAVANYIAKYATKTLHAPGVPDTRIRHASEIGGLRCSAHYRAMITTAWQLGSRQATGDPRFRQWAHMLGYGGHFLTKSRRYLVTFGQLRAARTSYRRAQRHPGGERDPWGRPLDETVVLVLTTWTYAGTSHNTATPAAELAAASAARAREHHGQDHAAI